MKKSVSLIMVLAMLVFTTGCTQYHAQGAGWGGLFGGAAGAMLDRGNSWRGFVIGATLGALAGATLTDVSMRASQEAATEGKPVEYRTTDGRGVYRADPIEYDVRTKCHKIQERVWEDGKLIKDEIKEVCEGNKTEPRY
ncbi:MAG: glycine zipper 2TM domain-containing protein [Nitrospirae bacterium]|nr:glycine zipper 2TM domain-containing protein [Nitrospirota bacterium]